MHFERNATMTTYGYIRDDDRYVAWVEDGGVFTDSTKKQKIGTERDGNLYSLDEKPLDMHLSDFNAGKPDTGALARLKKLAKG
jgi:hypothetical protein